MTTVPQRGTSAPAGDRRLSVAEASFYASVYGAARKGSLGELRRKGCSEEEAEEIFTAALEQVMKSTDPIARGFSEAQMVAYVKRACWFRLIDERRRRGVRTEVELRAIRSIPDSSALDPGEIAEEREEVAIGREALQMLPERDRLIFRQRHQMTLSPEEILQNTPGLSLRTYRKIIQRANARVLDAFEWIQGGERCQEMRAGLLRRYVTEESPGTERRAVEAHLAHCRACQRAQAEMRDYLVDIASGLLVASSLTEPSRGLRERVRELLLRFAMGLPGSGADAGAGQALGTSTIKLASACAGVAASVCLVAGVAPGVEGIGLFSRQHHTSEPTPKSAPRHATLPWQSPLIDALPRPHAETPADGEEHRSSARERGPEAAPRAAEPSTSTAQPASPVSNSPSDAQPSGRQTAREVGAESGGKPLPAGPPPSESGSEFGM